MAPDDAVTFLAQWYQGECNEDWEHQYGVKITTLDNPGWHLTVALTDTALQDATFPPALQEQSEHDWLAVKCEAQTFTAAGGPLSLPRLFELFRVFVERGGTNPLLTG